MPYQSPFNAIRNQFRQNRVNIADTESTDATSGPLAAGQFSFNTANYPDGADFTFLAVMSVSDGSLTGTLELYNLTDGETVATVTTSATTPTSLNSVLTVGTGVGELKTSAKVYELRLSVSGSLVSDIVSLGSAAIVVQ